MKKAFYIKVSQLNVDIPIHEQIFGLKQGVNYFKLGEVKTLIKLKEK